MGDPSRSSDPSAPSAIGERDDDDGALGDWVDASGPSAADVLARVLGSGRSLWRLRALLATSVRRELAARLTGTLLGRLWPLLHPLLLFAVYHFVFTRLLGFRLPGLPAEQASALGVAMFLGVLVWTGFADGLARATRSIADQGHLIHRVAFPSEILPLTAVLASLCTQLFGLAAFLLAAWFTPVWPAPGILLVWVPVLLVLQALFTCGLGLLLATLHVFVRDTQHFVALLTIVWMFLTPVFWVPSSELLPDLAPYLDRLELNPMLHLVQAWRGVLMSEQPASCFPHSVVHSVAIFALFSLGAFVLGQVAFALGERRFADEV